MINWLGTIIDLVWCALFAYTLDGYLETTEWHWLFGAILFGMIFFASAIIDIQASNRR